MTTEYLKTVKVRDGYFGDTMYVHLCYDNQSRATLAVHPGGWYNFGLGDCVDSAEARWYVDHHPTAKRQILN